MVWVRLVCSRGVDSVHPVRFRWNLCLRLHWTSNLPTDAPAGFSRPGLKNESARSRDSLFNSGMFAVSGLPERLVLLYVAYPISTSTDHLGSPSNPSGFQVLASIPEVRNSGESTSAVTEANQSASRIFSNS